MSDIISIVPVRYCTTCPADHRIHIDALLREQHLRCKGALLEMNQFQTNLFMDCLDGREETVERKRLDNMMCIKTARYKRELFKLKQYQIAYDDCAAILKEFAEDVESHVTLNRLNWTMDSAAVGSYHIDWSDERNRGSFTIMDAYAEMCEAAYLDYDYLTTGEVDLDVQLFLDTLDEPFLI